jgi:dTDP-glucose 4,6-dehydratase
VVVLDALTYAGSRDNLSQAEQRSAIRFVHGDILDFELVRSLLWAEGIDTIVHFAAESHVDRSIETADPFVQTNVLGTQTLLKAAKAVWLDGSGTSTDSARALYGRELQVACRFHHVSTDEVFGSLQPGDPPFTEQSPYRPNSPYAASKAGADHLVRAYARTYGLPVTISIGSNTFGPRQYPEKLIPLTVLNMLQGRPTPVYGDGSNIRDWLHVSDHCRGIETVIEHGSSGEMYSIAGRTEVSNLELVRSLAMIMDELKPESEFVPHSSLIRFVQDRAGHDFRYALDTSKVQRELGFEPACDFASCLRDCLKWYLENQDWCESMISKSRA